MGYRVSIDRMDGILTELRKEYRVFAPKRSSGRGGAAGSGIIRYGEISSVSEIVLDKLSDFSPKEVFYPIVQTMFYFNENECEESGADDRGIILFARPCDINGIKRLDAVFLQNGNSEDYYYSRLRGKLKIFMIECREGWDNCFCASMDANKTDDYSVALRFEPDRVFAEVKDEALDELFKAESECGFKPEFVGKNVKTVSVPEIDGNDLERVYGLEMWKEFDDKCLSCGGCNAVCITCSCFNTADIIYNETSRSGERRRVWASCMHEDFTTMAGGHKVRGAPGDRMRFKTLHKIYDFKAHFGTGNMCVGCGRCDNRCPEKISFTDTVNRLGAEVNALKDRGTPENE